MNDDNELDPVARLHAVDPARGVEPRAGFADEVIARVTGSVPGPVAGSTRESPVADLAEARTRRRPRWLAVAAVAASVAIVGATGYGLGATTGGTTNLADGDAAPPISLQTGGSPEGASEDGREPALGTSGGASSDQSVSRSTYPYGYGRNSFSASGLSSNAGTAQAYAFDPNAASPADTAAALAAALGIAAPVELRDGAWVAGPNDGSSPSLSVTLDGMLSFYYQNPPINPWLCDKGVDGAETCEPTGAAPSEAAAIAALRELIVAAGRDPGAFEYSSHVWEGSATRTAEAWPVVDGQRIDQAWSLELAEAGTVNANGALADIVGLGSYDVVSEQEGFERLSDPRFGSWSTILPMAADQSAPMPEEWVAPTAPPETPSAGTPLSWPVNDVEVVSVRLGLASQWQQDGSVLVVPAYEFTDADGGTWSVLAVADSMLDFTAE